ncbi:NB-ARC domain-containing protein [Dactylosporangium sucinum]|uniref:NB-ARC domain-containing protein n=1 Tax=Dactylosporangium sucinum TaxID=1424081 RepID=UPI001E411A83|nr:NB-ARC domain-containing protein [Dactylosporangium sucinum]
MDRDLAAALGPAGAGAVVVCQVLAGLGGVGKTQLAAGLAHRWWAQRRVDLLVWVSATSRTAVITPYAQAAAHVAGVDDADPAVGATRFLAWLAGTDRRWLIVLDDVTDPEDVKGLWPPPAPTGATVVTTRRRDAALLDGRHHIDVGVFTKTEAMAYLHAKLGGRLAEADLLAADLGRLPLALAQAAAYMKDQGLTCARYRQRLAGRRLADLSPQALPDDHPTAVAAVWALSVDLADRYSRGLATPVLVVAALLDPNGIPISVFTTGAVVEVCARRIGGPVDADDVADTVWRLCRRTGRPCSASTGGP